MWLEGDNANASYDSREHGAIPVALVHGIVWYKVLYLISILQILNS